MALSITTSPPAASPSIPSDEAQPPRSPVSSPTSLTPSQALTSAPKPKSGKASASLNKGLANNKAGKPKETLTLTTDLARTASVSSTVTPGSAASNAAPPKRKPSRRANTAERRATHNMVERQRRETLNGRFLDLSHLLPNLSQIRRPSKSSIVNSSIAHIHASRRHRLLASRVCLALTAENDTLVEETEALKRELNEWRDRAGLPRVALRDKDQAPSAARGEGYRTILGGELEVVMAVGGEEGGDEDDDGENKYGGYSLGGDVDMEEAHDLPDSPTEDDSEAGEPMMSGTNPFAHNVPTSSSSISSTRPTSAVSAVSTASTSSRRQSISRGGLSSSHGRARGGSVSVPQIHNVDIAVSGGHAFENPAMGMSMNGGGLSLPIYDHQFSSVSPHIPGAPFDKFSAMFSDEQSLLANQRSLFTPPSSSHGMNDRRDRKERGSFGRDREREQAFLFMQQQQQQQQQQRQQQQHQPTQQHHASHAMMQQYAQAQAHSLMVQQAARNQREGLHHCHSPDGDDCSSVGSCHSGSGGGRARSNSGSGYGSGYGSPSDDRWGNNTDFGISPVDDGRYDARGRFDNGYPSVGVNIPLSMNGMGMGGMGMMDQEFGSPEYDHPLAQDFDVPRRGGLRM